MFGEYRRSIMPSLLNVKLITQLWKGFVMTHSAFANEDRWTPRLIVSFLSILLVLEILNTSGTAAALGDI